MACVLCANPDADLPGGIIIRGAGFEDLWFQTLCLIVMGVTLLTISTLRFRKRLG